MKCYLSLRWRWVRVVASFSLAAAAMGIMHDSRAVPIEGITQYHLTLSRWVGDDNIVLGEGFFSFDQRAVDRKLNKWLADPDSFPFLFFPIELPVIEAEFEIFGHTFHADFHDDEIRWVEEYDDQGVVINVFVTMGDVSPFRVPPFIDFAAGFDQGQFLHYDVNGSFADCIEGFCEGQDAGGDFFFDVFQQFEWFEEPVTAPESGSLALLGLGLLGLGVTRRRAN